MDISALKRDAKAVSEGRWISDIPGLGSVEICARGMSSPEVIAARAAKARRIPRDQREEDGSLKLEDEARIMREILSEAVFIDVRGLVDDGKPVTADQIKVWLLDADYEPLADAVFYAAQMVDRTKAATAKAAEGN